jgi:predicted patatin/cPLA2 family phospholipase
MINPNEHPVIKLIRNRKEEGSLPNQRFDNYKLGLVLEGGGMRGVVGAGMATALHYLGLTNVFDAVYGSSAGALAGSLFVTQTMPIGPSIYYDDLIGKGFIDLKNMFSNRKPIMNIDFLMNTVLKQRKPLNWKGVIESDIPLNIIVSPTTNGKSLCINNYKTKDELFLLLKASATVPIIAGHPIKFKEYDIWDSAFYEPIPYKSALKNECTHLLVLLTRPKGVTKAAPTLIEKHVIAPKIKKIRPGLEIDYLTRNEKYNKSLEYLYAQNEHSGDNINIYSVYLPGECRPISGLVKNRNILLEGAKHGMQAVMNIFLDDKSIRYQEVLSPFDKFSLIPKL